MINPTLDQYFWLLVAFFWLVVPQIVLSQYRPRKGDSDMIKMLLKHFSFIVTAICIVFWLIQLSIDSPTVPLIQHWPTLQKWLAFTIVLFIYLAIVLWVFAGAGTRLLAKAFDITGTKVRLITALILLVAACTNVAGIVLAQKANW